MVEEHKASRDFLGVYNAGQPTGLVALFESSAGNTRYYMTINQLCDRIEHQMNTGMYYYARTLLKIDRAALMALIEAQRSVMAQKSDYSDYPMVDSGDVAFSEVPPVADNSESVILTLKE